MAQWSCCVSRFMSLSVTWTEGLKLPPVCPWEQRVYALNTNHTNKLNVFLICCVESKWDFICLQMSTERFPLSHVVSNLSWTNFDTEICASVNVKPGLERGPIWNGNVCVLCLARYSWGTSAVWGLPADQGFGNSLSHWGQQCTTCEIHSGWGTAGTSAATNTWRSLVTHCSLLMSNRATNSSSHFPAAAER